MTGRDNTANDMIDAFDFTQQPRLSVVLNPAGSAYPPTLQTLVHPAGTLLVTNSAYGTYALAPETIASIYGSNLASAPQEAPPSSLPTSLGGVTATLTDANGNVFPLGLFYVSPSLVNCLIPQGAARGAATVALSNGSATITGTAMIGSVAPGLYTANASGSGVPAGFWIRVGANGAQSQGYLYDPAKPVGSRDPVPVDLGAPGDQVFLSLYGTAFRGASQASATVGGVSVPVYGFSSVGLYQGEDLVNIGPLPRLLAGRGQVGVVATFDNQPANTVTVSIP
jgi:uncharacterized protein (TIGR03437 family)